MGPGFDLDRDLEFLRHTPAALDSLFREVAEEIVSAPVEGEDWTVFDVLGHLVHGEKTDWLSRTRLILAAGRAEFEPFDRFAMFEESRGKTARELLDEFARLRKVNLAELDAMNLGRAELALTGVHPEFGDVTLGQLLAAWVVHDLGHIAQAARIAAKRYREEIGPWRKYLPIVDR